MIDLFNNQIKFFFRNGLKVGPLWEIKAQEAIRVLVGSSLPRSIGVSKVNFQASSFFQLFEL